MKFEVLGCDFDLSDDYFKVIDDFNGDGFTVWKTTSEPSISILEDIKTGLRVKMWSFEEAKETNQITDYALSPFEVLSQMGCLSATVTNIFSELEDMCHIVISLSVERHDIERFIEFFPDCPRSETLKGHPNHTFIRVNQYNEVLGVFTAKYDSAPTNVKLAIPDSDPYQFPRILDMLKTFTGDTRVKVSYPDPIETFEDKLSTLRIELEQKIKGDDVD